MPPFLPSPAGIATGDAEAVGVHYVPPTERNPPLRIYYPASIDNDEDKKKKEVGFFEDTSTDYFLQGYWSVIMCRRRKRNNFLFQMGLTILKLVSWMLPMHYCKVPGVYRDAPPLQNENENDKKKQKLPLILFSHGLTGTGQENSVLLSAWSKQGYCVVSVHHTDGSSNRVTLADGSDLWYEAGPPFNKHYDPSFRPTQIQKRLQDLIQAREWLSQEAEAAVSNNPQEQEESRQQRNCRCPVVAKIDFQTMIAAGFSYGAATVALLATEKQFTPCLKGLIFLDGWFYIDVGKSAGVEFEFPKEAFECTHLKGIPALFVNSDKFRTFPKLWKATNKLVSKFSTDHKEPHVIEGSFHNNFCDLVFFCPTKLLQMTSAVGSVDPRRAYVDIVRLTNDFLKKHVR